MRGHVTNNDKSTELLDSNICICDLRAKNYFHHPHQNNTLTCLVADTPQLDRHDNCLFDAELQGSASSIQKNIGNQYFNYC